MNLLDEKKRLLINSCIFGTGLVVLIIFLIFTIINRDLSISLLLIIFIFIYSMLLIGTFNRYNNIKKQL